MRRRPWWFYKQSAIIPYRIVEGKIEILLITSLRKRHWIIPKGVIELGMTPGDSASKEAYEEAGVSGKVSEKSVGEYEYEKWGGVCSVQVFLMEVEIVLETWPEAETRERQWMTVEAAAEAIKEPQLQHLILKIPDMLP